MEIELYEGSASFFERASQEASIQPSPTKWFRHARLRNGEDYLAWPGLFEFVVSGTGRRIAGRFFSDASLEVFQTYFSGQVISFALLKLGIEPLHATVVVINGDAVAFLGDAGYGKSSLAAAFLQAGFHLLTDDLLVLRENGNGFLAFPGPPRIKLFPEIAEVFLGERITGTPMTPSTRKLIIPLSASQFLQAPVPLRAIYVLRSPTGRLRSGRTTIRRRRHRQACIDLITSTYNTIIRNPDRLARQFSLAALLSGIIPVKSLSYLRDLSRLPEVVETICASLTP